MRCNGAYLKTSQKIELNDLLCCRRVKLKKHTFVAVVPRRAERLATLHTVVSISEKRGLHKKQAGEGLMCSRVTCRSFMAQGALWISIEHVRPTLHCNVDRGPSTWIGPMNVSTSDDDFASPLIHGSGRFRRFGNSEDEVSVPSLVDPQQMDDPHEKVKLGCLRVKRATRHEFIVAGLMLAVIVTGAGNAVTSRIKGQAMGPFNFFLSLGNAVMYVTWIFSVPIGS